MYIRVWQIHSALFGNFSGTELNKSVSDSKLMEPEWQLDASPVLLDPFMHILLRDSSVWAQLLHRRNDLAECKSPVSPNQEWSEMRLRCYELKVFKVTISKILPKCNERDVCADQRVLPSSFTIPNHWYSMQSKISESSLKLKGEGGKPRGKSLEITFL